MITDSKVTEIFCIADDFCKEFEVEMEKKHSSVFSRRYQTPKKAHDVRRGGHHDSDLFPLQHLSQLQALLSVMCVRTVEASVPPSVLVQPFRGIMPRCFAALTMFLRLACFGEGTRISFIDSTCIPVIHNKREFNMKVFRGIAAKGKSTMGWYIGFKLHLLCNEKGELVNFVLTRGDVNDHEASVIDTLTDNVFGKLYANKGYAVAFRASVAQQGAYRYRTALKYETASDAPLRQDNAPQEKHHRVNQRHAQERGPACAFPSPQYP